MSIPDFREEHIQISGKNIPDFREEHSGFKGRIFQILEKNIPDNIKEEYFALFQGRIFQISGKNIPDSREEHSR